MGHEQTSGTWPLVNCGSGLSSRVFEQSGRRHNGRNWVRDLWVFMERLLTVVWTCLLGSGLALAYSNATSQTAPRPLRLIGCVFIIRTNVTCHWEPGDTPAAYYTLKVQIAPRCYVLNSSPNSSLKTFTCTTSGSSCTTGIGTSTVRICFCISVISHGVSGNVSSAPRCQPGRKEVILPPVILNSVQQVNGAPQCLNVSWSCDLHLFPVALSEIESGDLNSQMEFAEKGEDITQVRNLTVNGLCILVCLFRPDTLYTIRLRHRYQGPASPWSQWSNAVQGRTAEDTPSAAPVLWREVGHVSRDRRRLVSLLWKPLPRFLANGRVVLYDVFCQAEDGQILSDYGSCRKLQRANTSCSLPLPDGRWSCALAASNSAGTSPEDRVWIPGSSETEPPAPVGFTATPLGDSSMEVRWSPPPDLSATGYVVEWFAVREKSSSVLQWEKLDGSCTKLVIAEGLNPMERYAVSLKALYGEQGAGKNVTLHVYTRQGTPSAGPSVRVQQISGSSVELSWTPVPVELLHGFIRNYALFYGTKNQPAKSITVPGHVHRYTLENMPAGVYEVFIRASTVAGTGPPGNLANVHIGFEEISLVMCVVVPLLLISVMLVLMVLLAHTKIAKQKLFKGVPDPSNSTLSHWNPETSAESKRLVVEQEKLEVNCPEVILVDKLQDLERSHIYLHICNPQMFPYLQPSSPPAKASDKGYIRNTIITQSENDLSTSPCIYSNVLCSQFNQNLPPPFLPASYQASENSTACIDDTKQPAGGVRESSVFHFTSSDEQQTFRLFLEELRSQRSAGLLTPSPYITIRQRPPD
ncbi:interleukin-6 receptor subunit beta isoform 2-T2 [Fundulus diaphanus]